MITAVAGMAITRFQYIKDHEIESQAFHHEYGAADAVDVRGALHLGHVLERLVFETESLRDVDQIRSAYERALLELRGDFAS
jgi:hypothetical protein